jgi:hypothetical protein
VIRRLVFSILVVAVLAPVLSGDAAPPVLIARGVTLAGVPVGGLSNEQAQAALRPWSTAISAGGSCRRASAPR